MRAAQLLKQPFQLHGRFLFPAFGGLLYGYDIGATSCATISIKSAALSGTSWYNLSSIEIGLITSGALYGALMGSVLAFNVADFLGIRKELVFAYLLYLVGALTIALATGLPFIVIGRSVYGIGIGPVEKWIDSGSGKSTGRIKHPESLLKAVQTLVNRSQGVDLLAGVEAVISHPVVKEFLIPCALAPTFSLFPLSLSLCPKAASEEVGIL